MTFEQILDAAIELLQRRRRLTYAALKRQLELDDQVLEDLKQELIRGQRVAHDEDGVVLVWGGQEPHPADAGVEGERRQLTIMFCDLAGSTALSTSLDPEDLRVILRAFQDTAGAVIAQHEGFVNSYMGDGILVFFGYPQAQEDDAERAVRAALEIVAAVEALHPLAQINLKVRVGLATGLVVVGDIIGEGPSREEAVVGQTSNLAARLQSLAQPGEVIISGTTQRLVGSLFDCVDLGPQRLKGFDEPVPAWRITGQRAVDGRFEAAHLAAELGPLVGRTHELGVLVRRWQKARDGAGQVLTLRGEPGIGKSRLALALRESVASDSPTLLRYFCSLRSQNTALFPVIRQLEQAARLARDDSPAVKLDKLEALLQLYTPPEALPTTVPYIAALLSIPFADRYPPLADRP